MTSFLPLLSIALFFVVVRTTSSIRSIEGDGWLVGPFPDGNGLQLLSPRELADANWGGLASVLPGILVAVGVAVLSLLLNLTGLETMNRTRIDLEHETTTAGLSNIVVSPLGESLGSTPLAIAPSRDNLGPARASSQSALAYSLRYSPSSGAGLSATYPGL